MIGRVIAVLKKFWKNFMWQKSEDRLGVLSKCVIWINLAYLVMALLIGILSGKGLNRYSVAACFVLIVNTVSIYGHYLNRDRKAGLLIVCAYMTAAFAVIFFQSGEFYFLRLFIICAPVAMSLAYFLSPDVVTARKRISALLLSMLFLSYIFSHIALIPLTMTWFKDKYVPRLSVSVVYAMVFIRVLLSRVVVLCALAFLYIVPIKKGENLSTVKELIQGFQTVWRRILSWLIVLAVNPAAPLIFAWLPVHDMRMYPFGIPYKLLAINAISLPILLLLNCVIHNDTIQRRDEINGCNG